MRIPDPKANTTTEAYLAYKAGYLEESELKSKLYKPDWHFDGWLAYWAGLTNTYPLDENGDPEMLCDEEALVAYLSGVTDTYPEEIKNPYDVRIVGYLKHLAAKRWPEPDYPVNNEEFYLSTMEPTHTSNPTPSADIELDTSEGKIISVEAYGDTFQQTYSGKNLLQNTATSQTISGVTFTINSDKSITCNGTATANAEFRIVRTPDLPDNKDMLLTGCPVGGSSSTYQLQYSNNRDKAFQDMGNGIVIQKMDYNTYPDTYVQIRIVKGYTCNNLTFYPMIRLATIEDDTYEPYTGGIPSPNPSYPQEVEVVTGNVEVKVQNKNWFDSEWEQGYIDGTNGAEIRNNGCIRTKGYISVKPTQHYAFKRNITTGYMNVRGYNKNKQFVGVGGDVITLISGSSENNPMNAGYNVCVIAPKDNIYYLRFNDTSNDLHTQYMMVKGDTPIDYTPHKEQVFTFPLGNIELCKIGNYQDYLYKNNGKWYLHKEIKKILLNGTEGWSVSNNVFYLTSISDYINSSEKICLSDKYTAINNTNVGTSAITQNNSICFFSTNTNPRLYIRDERFNNVNAFKAELSENNAKVYYPTVTPTDTEITDSTLIAQLNALAGADTYDEKTYIKVTANDPNLPALLKVEAYKY